MSLSAKEEELIREEVKLRRSWRDVLENLRRDLAYIWSPEVQENFTKLKAESSRIELILKSILRTKIGGKALASKVQEDVKRLQKHLRKIVPSKEWIRTMYTDLADLIKDTQLAKQLGRAEGWLDDPFGDAESAAGPMLFRREFTESATAAAIGFAMGFPRKAESEASPNKRPQYETSLSLIDESDFSIQVSTKVLNLFKKAFDLETEDYFLLLANQETGIIEKVTDQYTSGTVRRAFVEPGFRDYLDVIARKHGYFVVGNYHTHVQPPPKTSGDLLSGRDVENSSDSKNDLFWLLGHGSQQLPFRTRAYIPFTKRWLGEKHPYLARKEEFMKRRLFPISQYAKTHQYLSFRSIELSLKPVPVPTHPQASRLLAKYPPFMRSTTLSIEPEKYRAAVSAMKQHLFHEEEEIATTLKNHVLCSLDVSIWYNGQIRFFLHTKNSKKKGWQSEKIDVRLIVKDNIIQQNSYFFARNGATDIGQKYLPQVYRALGPLLKKAPGKFKMACKQIRGLDIP